MSDEKKKKEDHIEAEMVSCPSCRGEGISGNGDACDACGGKGVYLNINGSEYFFGKELSGHSSAVRSFHLFVEKLLRMMVYVFALIALFYGFLFVVTRNQGFFSILTSDIGASGAESVSAGFLIGIFYLVFNSINAFSVVFREYGFEPLMFWSGSLGVAFCYYYSVAGDLSKKEINILNAEFKPFYEKDAPRLEKPVDVSLYASQQTLLFFKKALDLAYIRGQAPSVLHMARVLAGESGIGRMMMRMEIDAGAFISYLDAAIDNLPSNDFYSRKGFWKETVMSPEMKNLAVLSMEESIVVGLDKIEPESVFLALLYYPEFEKYFHNLKLERQDMRSCLLWTRQWGSIKTRTKRPRKIRHTVMNRAWTARVTPELDQFSYDMTDYARSGLTGYIVNRQRELDNLMRILERTSKNNALLIGEEGCGRTAIVKALANRMIHDEVLPTLRDKRLVVLDIGALVSGARAGGDLEMRIRTVMEDMGRSGNVILYIPDIHNMAAAGSGEGFDASKVLSPILNQGLFQIIGSTDYRNYRRYIEPRGDFANNFDKVKVDELSEEDTLKVLAVQAGMIESRENIVMTYGAIKKAVELSKRYISDRLLPGKAIDLLSETAVEVRRRGAGLALRDEDVMEVITEKTGIPLTSINSNEAEKLLNLEENLHSRVIGQDQAVKSVASAIRRVRVGMKQENRPIGTFLFLGPTGVGKTELAKALSEVYYGDENAMIRLDMSEYQTVGSVEKLIGYSSGGQEEMGGGILTEAVKRKPFSLILLDELEKANKNVLNLFLQVFDDGRLTDNLGRTVDFTNAIIIATSNAGSKVISKMFVDEKSSNARILEMMEPYLLQSFAPEFLNRFTDKIVFQSLTQQDLSSIARLQIRQLAERLDQAQGIKIDISEEAISYLVEMGYSAEYGARFLQRTIQEKLENLIAVEFLKGEIKRGQTFKVGLEDLKEIN